MFMKPFPFWCNKILPLVYDDSLSYYELLCKVVDYINKLGDQVNKESEAIRQLINWVNNYFSSTDFQQLVNDKLDEMAQDGTLDSIVNAPKMFVPNRNRRNAFKNSVLANAASYLYFMKDSDCITRASVPASMFKPIYNTNGKGWQSLVSKDNIYTQDFDYDDTSGGSPVMYTNCTGFVTMLTMGRGYQDSPYYAAFNGLTDDLRSYCSEIGGILEYPWTLDFLHWQHSYNMFYIMESSGCNPNPIYDKVSGWDLNLLSNAESGDILFDSNSYYSSYYEAIHHCGIYLKSLDDINAVASAYGTFHPVVYQDFEDDPSYGYIIHCSSGYNPATGERGYEERNVIRIDTLYHSALYGNTAHGDEQHTIYLCKPYANALNSSKRKRVYDFSTVTQKQVLFGLRNQNTFPTRSYFTPEDNYWHLYNMGMHGILAPSDADTDLNDMPAGMVYWTSSTKSRVQNKPDDTYGTVYQFGDPDSRAVQLAWMGTTDLYYRIKFDGTWRDWKQVANPSTPSDAET